MWIHLDSVDEESRRWLEETSGLEPTIIDTMLDEETRPHSVKRTKESGEDAWFVNLRGIRLEPEGNPEDMAAISMWVKADRIITVRQAPLKAIPEIRAALNNNTGPKDAGDVVVTIAHDIVSGMEPVVMDLDHDLAKLELRMASVRGELSRDELEEKTSHVRRRAINLRRHLAPQPGALSALSETVGTRVAGGLFADHQTRLREITDRAVRYVEDLDTDRERASILYDQPSNLLAERTNRILFVLSVVAAIFLPLEFLTGLFGVNLGGIPGIDDPWAFPVFAGVIFCVMIILLFVFLGPTVLRRKRRPGSR